MVMMVPAATAAQVAVQLMPPLPIPTAPPPLDARNELALGVQPRATTDFGLDNSCFNIDLVNRCGGQFQSCILNGFRDINYFSTGALDQYNSCYCSYGLDYLNCYFSGLGTQCFGGLGITDIAYYTLDWYGSSCGTVPASVMAKITPPTSVSLQFDAVRTTTIKDLQQPARVTSPPAFKGTGKLLDGQCSSTSFTLVDVGSTVFFAGFVGCVSDRPQCCPWTVADAAAAATRTAAITSGSGDAGPQQFPLAADAGQQKLKGCPDDYYTIFGGGACCPLGHFPFTRAIAGQTPCYSSLARRTTAPVLTAGLDGQPTDKSLPTSAVVNIVWAVSYQVNSSGNASLGAIIGGAVGGVAALGIAGGLIAWVIVRRRRRDAAAKAAAAGGGGVAGGKPGENPQMVQQFSNVGTSASPGFSSVSGVGYGAAGAIGTPGTVSSPQPSFYSNGVPQQHMPGAPMLGVAPMPTGSSTGGVSELSSQGSGQPIMGQQQPQQTGGYFNGMPQQQQGYPAPIAEAPSEHQQWQQQQYQGQQQPQQWGQQVGTPGSFSQYYTPGSMQGYDPTAVYGQQQQYPQQYPQQQQSPPPQGYYPQQAQSPPPQEMHVAQETRELAGETTTPQPQPQQAAQAPPPAQQQPPPAQQQ